MDDNKETTKEVEPSKEVEAPKDSAFVQKLLTEKKNWAAKAEALERQLKEKEAILEQATNEKLKESGNIKELLEKLEKENIELKTKQAEIIAEEKRRKKLGAVKKELEKLGADSTSMDFLLNNVKLEALKHDEDHNVVLGVEDEALRIKAQVPQVFGKKSSGVSHDAPTTDVSSLDIDAWKKMSYAEKKKNLEALYKAKNIPYRP